MRSLLFALLALLLAPAVFAQQAAPEITPERREAAAELLEEMRIGEQIRHGINATFEAQAKQNPQMAMLSDVMARFVDKYLTWEQLREPMVEIYAGMYTADEMHELIAFYRTDLGRKTIDLMPEVAARTQALGQEIVAEHQDELVAMIQEHMKAQGGASSSKTKP